MALFILCWYCCCLFAVPAKRRTTIAEVVPDDVSYPTSTCKRCRRSMRAPRASSERSFRAAHDADAALRLVEFRC